MVIIIHTGLLLLCTRLVKKKPTHQRNSQSNINSFGEDIMKKINWGVIAPGNIATKFCTALQEVESAELYSVASRTPTKAKTFADKFNFVKYAQHQQELLSDPLLDVVYIASPHMFHADAAIECLKAGKSVLCEKPMSINSSEADLIFTTAKDHNTFFMEAVWTRFMPVYQQIFKWIDEGLIGEVKMLQASFGISRPFDPSHRLYDLNLAGGALLDVGIYPITFAQMVMQEAPERISAFAHIGQSGVDESNAITLQYKNGTTASLNSAINSKTSHEAWIYGTKGNIKIPEFWHPQSAQLETEDTKESVSINHKINGYEYEIEEVHNCLQAKLLESPNMSWEQSKTVVNIMDEVRSQVGLKYPNE
jgi:predicted dehydrogenase